MRKPAIEGGSPVREKDFIVFGSPDIRQEEIEEVVSTLKSGWLSTGPKVKLFEEKFSEYQNMKYGVGTNSCTAALHLCLDILDLPKDSEVITTDMTFCASVNAILHAGLKPVIVDCNIHDGNISINRMKQAITKNTKAIIPVHYTGMPCDVESIAKFAKDNGLVVISDAAHAVETRYKGKSVAEYSDMTAYSFYATKNICTGEGGMILTDNKEYADKARIRALHGMSKGAHLRYGSSGFKSYSIDSLGYKYNMMDIVASIGIHQLKRIDKNWARRKEIWDMYSEEFVKIPSIMMLDVGGPDIKHGHHMFTILLDLDKLTVGRGFVLDALIAENVGTGIHFVAIHEHPYYKEALGLESICFPNAQWISDRTLSLPLSPKLTDKDVGDIIKAVTKILTYYRR